MRSKRALINTLSGMLYEIVSIICGLIVPRLILGRFGSEYNGITASITQFLSGIALLKAGIGGVTRAALYKPLASDDTEKISSIVVTTQHFMRKIAIIFAGLVLFFACIYPLWVKDAFDWLFAFSLVIILSISTFAQYFFGLTYQMLLQAAQRQSYLYFIQIGTTIVNTIVAAALIALGSSIHVVKLGSAIVFALNPLLTNLYARKKFHINLNAEKDNSLIKQRWDAFGQEVAFFVHNNTDLIVLTIFTNLYEVSVYTVYNYVLKGIREVVVMCITSFDAAFGDMLAKREHEIIEKNFRIYELIVFSVTAILYTTAGALIVPYALLYTHGVQDVNYSRPLFAAIIILAGAFSCFRIPYKTIVDAAGHFTQTRNGAIVEALLNITISVLLVNSLGLVGVAIGTLFATMFRSFQYAFYLKKNILNRNIKFFIKHIVLCLIPSSLIIIIAQILLISRHDMTITYWIVCACIICLSAIIVVCLVNWIFYKEETKDFFKKIINVLNTKRGK